MKTIQTRSLTCVVELWSSTCHSRRYCIWQHVLSNLFNPTALWRSQLWVWNISGLINMGINRKNDIGPLLTSYAIPVDDSPVPYLYVGADNGYLFKLSFPSPQDMKWDILERINPVGPSMCVLGVMDVPTDTLDYQADILIYSGEGADSQVLAVSNVMCDSSLFVTIDLRLIGNINDHPCWYKVSRIEHRLLICVQQCLLMNMVNIWL